LPAFSSIFKIYVLLVPISSFYCFLLSSKLTAVCEKTFPREKNVHHLVSKKTENNITLKHFFITEKAAYNEFAWESKKRLSGTW
jgi:hypothetical protein